MTIESNTTAPLAPSQVLDAYKRFDLTDVHAGDRVGVSYTYPGAIPDVASFTSTRFARVDKLTADERGVCVAVTYDDGETETCHVSRVTYVDGKHVLP